MQKTIYANGSAEVLIPKGQKIAIATYGNDYATISFKRGNNLEFVQRLDNDQVILGAYADNRTVVISAASDAVFYSVSEAPFITDGRSAQFSKNNQAITGLDGNGVSIWAKPSPNSILAKWDVGTCTAVAANASDLTYHETLTVEYSATRFRIALMNINASTCVVGPVKMATSNRLGNDVTFGSTTGQARVTPSTGAWVNVLFGGSTTVTLPARISATQPSITYSDWVELSTVARIDGGTLPVVMIRLLIPSAGTTNPSNFCQSSVGPHFGQAISSRANRGSVNTTWTNGRLHQVIQMTGDGVTTPANFTPTTDYGYVMVAGVEYMTRRPGFTVLANGDSIMAGAVNGNTGNLGNGWIWQMMQLIRNALPNTPLELANIAVSSTSTDTFLSRMNTYIAAGGKFDLAVYAAFSPNDGTPNQAKTNAANSLTGQAIDALKTANRPVVLVGPCPNTAANWDATADAFRLGVRTEVLDAAYTHVVPVDLEVVGNGATPVRFNPAYSTDGTHPNEAGYAVIAETNAANVVSLFA